MVAIPLLMMHPLGGWIAIPYCIVVYGWFGFRGKCGLFVLTSAGSGAGCAGPRFLGGDSSVGGNRGV